MAFPFSSRLSVSGFALVVTGAFGLGGCQLLLDDRSGSGGTGSGTTATHGSSTSKTSATSTTGTSSKTSSTATGTTGTGTTTTTATGTMTATSSASTGGGCTPGGGGCSEATPNFPTCTGIMPVTCGTDLRCSAYCNSMKVCNMAGKQQYASNDQCCAFCALMSASPPPFDAGTFCCRADALNMFPETADTCTAGGPFGNSPGGSGNCGDQAQRVCAFAAHVCQIPACTNCESKVGTNGDIYVWNDMNTPSQQLMTLALTALSSNVSTHQAACTTIGTMFCN